MSTPCTIAVKTEKGYKAIYCHHDGNPEYMYPMLRDWYATQERANALVSFGDASSVHKRLSPSQDSGHSFDHPEEDVCVFYHRDRGEDFYDSMHSSKADMFRQQYYVYIFEDDNWRAYVNGREVRSYEY